MTSGPRFCSKCGSKHLERRTPPDDYHPRWICSRCHTIHHQSPRLVVSCLPLWNDHILLCRRATPPGKGLWNLPGGLLEWHETLEAGVRRELWEEARAHVGQLQLLSVYSIPEAGLIFMCFEGTLLRPNWAATPESSEVQLFHPNHLPLHQIAFDSTQFALHAHRHNMAAGNHQVHVGDSTTTTNPSNLHNEPH